MSFPCPFKAQLGQLCQGTDSIDFLGRWYPNSQCPKVLRDTFVDMAGCTLWGSTGQTPASCSINLMCVISVSELGNLYCIQLIYCYDGCWKSEKHHYMFDTCVCVRPRKHGWPFFLNPHTPSCALLLFPVALLPTSWASLLIHWGFAF